MKFIQTLNFDKAINPLQHSFGWKNPEFHLLGWALSCLQLNKIYGNAELYASTSAAKLLIDVLGLPYSKVHITHDKFYLPDKKLWALSKIHTYSLQNAPFVHIDGDVFIFSKFPKSLLSGKLIAQNFEEATNYYTATQKELVKHLSFFPGCVANDFSKSIPITAINAGILGGNNIKFIQSYSKKAVEYVQKNENQLAKIDPDKFNVFFEQHLFYSMATEKKIPINVLINERVKDNQYNNLSNFHEVSFKKNYLHLLGHYKRDEFTCIQMAATLRELYPDHYYKVIALFKSKSIPLFFSFYDDQKMDTLKEYEIIKKEAKASYQNGFLNDKNKSHEDKSFFLNFEFLKALVDNFQEAQEFPFTKRDLRNDFNGFVKTLNEIVQSNEGIPACYLYGRDIDCIKWYPLLFNDATEIKNHFIAKCEEVLVFKSQFDWPRLLRSENSEGREYYKYIELFSGDFFNMAVPELFGEKYSLFDIDEMENTILLHLAKPLQIEELFIQMHCYVEDDIIENHLVEYENLIIAMLKQLVLKKAIKPFQKKHFKN